MARRVAHDDTGVFMRQPLVVIVWLLATAGVVYVANAAVELVDLQVFPEGASIRVLERASDEAVTPTTAAEPAASLPIPTISTTSEPVVSTTVPVVSTTTVPVVTTTVPVVTTTVPVAPTTTVPVVTTTVPVVTTTVPVVPTTTVPVTPTTVPPTVSTTTVPAPQLLVVDSGTVEVRSGSSYRARLASGGSPPYEWSVLSGSLPAGLELAPDGFIEGSLEGSGRFQASVQVTDSAGLTRTTTTAFVIREYRFIRARGGSVTVVVTGDSVGFFSALHGEGYESTQVLRSGPIVVEVAFLPISGDEVSWVRCEVVDGVSCTQD